jgi:hypothetical protein
MDENHFVNAVSRFIDMRGIPSDILSDNWSTFVSPEKELESWVKSLNQDLIIKKVPADINWIFTPPYGPHHGGVYEIMVKSFKRSFYALLENNMRPDLTMDEFRTLISRCAALVNGRPLTRTEIDNKSIILTPNHFLHGSLGGSVSTKDIEDPVKKWKQIHSLVNQFWEIYLKEYLPELRKSQKWKEIRKNIQVGDLVLEMNPNQPRGNWQLGIVTEVEDSVDNLVRKCWIRTAKGVYHRPISRLCPLELNISD